MAFVTSAHVRQLADAEFGDLPVLAIDGGEVEVFPQSTAVERGAEILTDAAALLDYSGGELDDTLAAQFARELNEAHGLTEGGEDTEEFDNPDGYVAAVAIASDVVAGDHCDVSVIERAIVGYRDDEDGEETPVYGLGDRVVYHADTGVNVDADDAATRAITAATELLEAAGWEVVGEWEYADNAVYAVIARA